MGDSGITTRTSTLPSSNPVFHAWKSHCSAPHPNTELTVLEFIRNLHPTQHVTVVPRSSCDLIGYAEAGHAKTSLDTANDAYVSQRRYKAPPGRSRNAKGTLEDDVTFGQYKYTWEGSEMDLYCVQWIEPRGCGQQNSYLVTPKDDVNEEGHSALADRLIAVAGRWSTQLHEEIYVFDGGYWQKNSVLWAAVQTASWDDVILNPAMKATMIADVSGFFERRDVYREYGVPWKRGIIFHGTPGCGKTISIKALMNSLQEKDVASLYVKSFDAQQGDQHSVRSIFKVARVMAPCLLIFEDLDSLVKDEVRSYFLNEVDGLEDNDGIFMIGSTNHLDRLDPGIAKRPSRFDRKYHYQLPGPAERVLYAQYWQKKLVANKHIDFADDICQIVSRLTEGFSFAYMKELFVQSLLAIAGARADNVDSDDEQEDVEEIAQKTVVSGDQPTVLKEGESTSSTAQAEVKSAEGKSISERQMPRVKIPDSLKANPFLHILRKQAAVLIREMDNTKEERAKISKVPNGAADSDCDSDY